MRENGMNISDDVTLCGENDMDKTGVRRKEGLSLE